MHWGLQWYSAQSHLNKVLIRICVFRVCYDKSVIKAIRVRCTIWERARAVVSFLRNRDGVDGTMHARVGVAA